MDTFERIINVALFSMLAIVVLLATVGLGWIILNDILTPPVVLLNVEQLLDLFGSFLLVLIGVELLHTIEAYLTAKTIHVEVVLLVSIIAIARKVVILEPRDMDSLKLTGIAAIITALTIGYYFVKLAARNASQPDAQKPQE
jgi:uncharacterized membrane protein (DUF373 family)